MEYRSVGGYGEFTYEDRKSVFIGQVYPVENEEEAQEKLALARDTYPDARHHVYAYLLREGGTVRFSDDHEPQGTAGVPILDILKKKELTNLIVVVTRYFGGTLLGTGGLVRAYSEAALGALDAAGIVTYSLRALGSFSLSYGDYQKLAQLEGKLPFRVENVSYADAVRVRISLPVGEKEPFIRALADLSSGSASVIFDEEKFSF